MAVARVIGVKGLRGAIRVELLTDWPEHLAVGSAVFIEGEPEPRRVVRHERGGRVPSLELSGIETRDDAERLRGRFLEREAEPLPPGELYWHQLEGMRVEDTAGRRLGVVVGVFRAGENEVYEVETTDGGELLVPALHDVVRELDTKRGCLVIDYRSEEVT